MIAMLSSSLSADKVSLAGAGWDVLATGLSVFVRWPTYRDHLS